MIVCAIFGQTVCMYVCMYIHIYRGFFIYLFIYPSISVLTYTALVFGLLYFGSSKPFLAVLGRSEVLTVVYC